MGIRNYEDPRALGLLVCILAGAIGLMTLAVFGLDLSIDARIPGAMANATSLGQIHSLQVIRLAVDTLLSMTFILNSVLFFVWLYRAVSNHLALGARAQEYPPGWSVGYFFIPFINIVLPYFVVREVWMTSHDLAGASTRARAKPVLAWWVLYLLSGMLLWIAGQVMGGHTRDLSHILHSNMVEMVGFTLRLAAMTLFIHIVWTTTRLQRVRANAPPGDQPLRARPPDLSA
jgi:hypothetical protein